MSSTVVTYPMVTALVEAEQILGPDRQWKPVNEMQTRFLKECFDVCRKERVPEIESLASWDAAEISAFLTQRGFPVVIPPFKPLNFGTASVLDLLVVWAGEPKATAIRKGLFWLRKFPAVRIPSGQVEFFRSPGHRNPIARVSTKSDDDGFITMHTRTIIEFDLMVKAQELSRNRRRVDEFEDLVFPMIKLDHGVDINWLTGMETTELHDQPVWIEKAIQQTRLRVNEVGARAESAVLIAPMVLSARWSLNWPKPDHVVKRPFLIWFERKGLSKPLFVGHITEGDWRNPGDISK